jgi:hypothetical protein
MDPNEGLLLFVESILDDDELDDASRNAALAETVKQFAAFTGPPHAKAIIMKRDDVEAQGKAGFDDGVAVGDSRTRLRLAYEDKRRSYPNLGDAHNLGLAWRSLSSGERNALLEAEDGGEDPTFDHEKVDVGKLADFLLEVRSELVGKTQPGLSREAAFAAACEAHPEIFKVARAARRAQLTAGNVEGPAAAVGARHFATQLLTKHAEQIRHAKPTLSIEAARIEARRRFLEIAANERA